MVWWKNTYYFSKVLRGINSVKATSFDFCYYLPRKHLLFKTVDSQGPSLEIDKTNQSSKQASQDTAQVFL